MPSTTTARDTGLEVVHEVSTIIRPGQYGLGLGVPVGVVPRGALIQILYIFPLGELSGVDNNVTLSLGTSPTGNEILGANGPIPLFQLTANFVQVADKAANDLLSPQVIYVSLDDAGLWLPGQGAVAVVVSYSPFVPG